MTDEEENHSFLYQQATAALKREKGSEFRSAVDLDLRLAAIHFNLAETLEKIERTEDAIEAYRAGLRLAPQDARAHLFLGNLLSKQGQHEEARSEWDKAIATGCQAVLKEAQHMIKDSVGSNRNSS